MDDNNNLRQGSLGLEEGLSVTPWPQHQFFALLATSESNTHAFYTKMCTNPLGGLTKNTISILQLRQKLARAHIHNMYLPQADESDPHHVEDGPAGSVLTQIIHSCPHPPTRENTRMERWQRVHTMYVKHKCSGPNWTQRIRTYCSCNPCNF